MSAFVELTLVTVPLLPTQATNANKYLQTDGTNTSWVAGNSGTVTRSEEHTSELQSL